ncbi:MAG: hypothetical protein HOQ05_03195 [Corynebacteriales bacterium]|nr:hypothetical protein [Mycobacteriales bacterium]
MRVEDFDSEVVVTMTRGEFFLMRSLMMEAVELGDDWDFRIRVGATKDEVLSILDGLPDLPLGDA